MSANFMSQLIHPVNAVSGRSSSTDRTGGNKDYWMLPPNETTVLTEIEGPGCINHIWMTSFCKHVVGPSVMNPDLEYMIAPTVDVMPVIGVNWEANDEDYYRKVLIKMTWDGQDRPSVLVPLGDFFGVGNSMPGNYSSMPFTISANPEALHRYGGPCAMNCYFQMPFAKKAKIEIVNENDWPLGLFFHIDYELYREPFKQELLYFHATWNRNNPCNGWAPDLPANCPEVNEMVNLTGEDNYVLLDIKGKGHYVGCNMSIIQYQGICWCEGDEMIFVDGEELPSINGTGIEDYFNHAWGIQKDSHLYAGSIVNPQDVENVQVAYRFHIVDPIRFDESLRVTMEHGHANHLADDWSSTAYWYQTLPSPVLEILPVELRLPTKVNIPGKIETKPAEITAEQEKANEDYINRRAEYLEAKKRNLNKNIERTKLYAGENINYARRLREKASK